MKSEDSLPNSSLNKQGFLGRFHRRIVEKATDHSTAPFLIVALGDSVTAGAAGLDELLHEEVYHAQLKRLLQERYPASIFSVINAGVGGDTAFGGLQRLDRDVVRHQPDLVLVAFGLNDATSDEATALSDYQDRLEKIISGIREGTEADVILMTPNMMPTRDNDAIPDCYKHLTTLFLHLQNDGVLASFAEKVRAVGKSAGVPVADIYAAWESRAAQGEDTTAMLSNGLNHPDARGHALAAGILMDVIERAGA